MMNHNIRELKKLSLKYIDKHSDDIINLCSRLIQFPSENPPGNVHDIAFFIKEYLEKFIEVKSFEIEKNRISLVSTLGEGETPSLILYGHMDVVPAGDAGSWSFPPFSGWIRNGKILGRGAADMKGGLTAAIYAFLSIVNLKADIPGRITLTIVPDEESDGRSSCWLLDNHKVTGDACIMGEPTMLKYIAVGDKGDAWFRFIATGKPAHGSTPMLGENAITKMSKVLSIVERIKDKQFKPPSEIHDDIEITKNTLMKMLREIGFENKAAEISSLIDHCAVNIGVINGGSWINTVPESCTSEVAITVPIGVSPENIKDLIRQMLNDGGLMDVKIEFILKTNPTYTPIKHKLVRILSENVREVLGLTPEPFYFIATSDAVFYREKGIATVHYGPGSMAVAHAFDEFVQADEVIKAAKVYASTAIDYIFR